VEKILFSCSSESALKWFGKYELNEDAFFKRIVSAIKRGLIVNAKKYYADPNLIDKPFELKELSAFKYLVAEVV